MSLEEQFGGLQVGEREGEGEGEVDENVLIENMAARANAEEAMRLYANHNTLSDTDLQTYHAWCNEVMALSSDALDVTVFHNQNVPQWFIEYLQSETAIQWKKILIACKGITPDTWTRFQAEAVGILSEFGESTIPVLATGAHPSSSQAVQQGRLVCSLLGLHDTTRDADFQFEAVQSLRRILSCAHPPITSVLSAQNVAVRMLQFMGNSNEPLQFESAWALTNMASGNSSDTRRVVQLGILPVVSNLLGRPLSSPQLAQAAALQSDSGNLTTYESVKIPHAEVGQRSLRLTEQLLWLLGNVAGDSVEFRDAVLWQCDSAVLRIVDICELDAASMAMKRNAIWALSNLCRGKPQPAWNKIRDCVAPLARVVKSTDDTEVLTDAMWAFSYITDSDNERIQAILAQNLVGRLVDLLVHRDRSVQTPALRTIGNIVTGTDEMTDAVVSCPNFFSHMRTLVTHGSKPIRKEACWTMSNIAAGSRDQIERLLTSDGVFSALVAQASNPSHRDVQKEALWSLINASTGGSVQQLGKMNALGAIAGIACGLDHSDKKVVRVSIEGLMNFARQYEAVRNMCQALGSVALADLQLLISDQIMLRLCAIRDEDHPMINEMISELIELLVGIGANSAIALADGNSRMVDGGSQDFLAADESDNEDFEGEEGEPGDDDMVDND